MRQKGKSRQVAPLPTAWARLGGTAVTPPAGRLDAALALPLLRPAGTPPDPPCSGRPAWHAAR